MLDVHCFINRFWYLIIAEDNYEIDYQEMERERERGRDRERERQRERERERER